MQNNTLGKLSVCGASWNHSFSVVRPVVELYKNDGIIRKTSGNN